MSESSSFGFKDILGIGGIICLGGVLRGGGILGGETAARLGKVVINVTVPCMLLNLFWKEEVHSVWIGVTAPSIALFHSLLMFLVARRIIPECRDKGLLVGSCLGWNVGMFGFPIFDRLYPDLALPPPSSPPQHPKNPVAAVLESLGFTPLSNSGKFQVGALFDIGNVLVVYGMVFLACSLYPPSTPPTAPTSPSHLPLPGDGSAECPLPVEEGEERREVLALPMLGGREGRGGRLYRYLCPQREDKGNPGSRVLRKVLSSPPILSIFGGIALNCLWPESSSPIAEKASSLFGYVGKTNAFLALLTLGLSSEMSWVQLRSHGKQVGMVLALRLGGALAGIASLYVWKEWLGLPSCFTTPISICLLLPTPLVILPFAFEFGFDPQLASSIMGASIVASLSAVFLFVLL